MPSKRSRDEEDLQIKVASGQPLPIKSLVARTFSSCAEQLPASAQEWDVSGLLLDSEAFSHDTIKCWVDCAYCALYGQAELDDDDIQQLSTVKGLQQVLAFAHAVGSAECVLAAACSQVSSLKVVVQLPEQTLEVPVGKQGPYCFIQGGQLACLTLRDDHPFGNPCASEQGEADLQRQVAAQLGALLHLAHALHLLPLLGVLHDFVFWSVIDESTGLLLGVLSLVFTDQVLQAAVGSSTVSKDAYIASVLTRPHNLEPISGAAPALLKRFGEIDEDDGSLSFRAHLLQDFAGGQAGDEVRP